MTKIIEPTVLLGGIYTIQEAALYARVSSKTLHRWFTGNADGDSVINPIQEIEHGKFINFLDFIQTLAIRAIRNQYKIPLYKIREAIENAKSDYDVEYPFARKHITYTDGKEIFIEFGEDLVNLTGKHQGQLNFKRIVELYLEDLAFGDEGYAIKFTPAEGIILTPKLRFGEPVVEKCGITAYTLYEAAQIEGGFERAAYLYEVSIEDVKTAYRYFDSLKNVA
jgi:uncharacterized protein (DUF433 family)